MIGNCRTAVIAALLREQAEAVREFGEDSEAAILSLAGGGLSS